MRSHALTDAHRARKQRGETHPIEDFLWTYYSVKPNELHKWHPGAGVALEGAAEERAAWKYYGQVASPNGSPAAIVDIEAYFARREATVNFIEELLTATLAHTPRYGCFGLHEWAMVYRMTPEQLRHTSLPLRIGQEATNEVVETHTIGCTHFDAFRFFTPDAAPLNTLPLSRDTQQDTEQAGCLHAGMDLYKWAAKLGPIVPGEVLLDAFVFARDIREVDMRASPYDVTGYDGADGAPLTPITIENADGKREYARLQRGFAERGNAIRARLLDAIAAAKHAR
nr:3-methyladenine DNA glycosylase [Leucobacter exalbidus]